MESAESHKILNNIYQNLTIALQSIDNILPSSKGQDIEDELAREYNEYSVLLKEVEMLARAENLDLKGNNFFDKAKLWTSIKFSTFFDNSQTNLCEMMILGTTMGIIDLVKVNAKFESIDIDIRELASKLLKFQKNNFEVLLDYLK